VFRRAQPSLAISLCVGILGCASRAGSPARPVVLGTLLDIAESSDEEEANTALFLLAHVSMREAEEKRLKADLASTKDPIRRLLLAYVMDSRFQFVDYRNAFVELYPEGARQEVIWNLRSKFVSAPSPLEERLAYLAKTDEKALDKLVSGIPFADGVDAEFLVDEVSDMYRHQPEAVMRALAKAQVSPARVRIDSDKPH
jgi:hypothetical protein